MRFSSVARGGWWVLLTFALVGTACAATEGLPAPAIRATLLDGTSFTSTDFKGKVVLVNMWATWCAPCREEMPALDAYYRAHRDEGLVMVAVSMDMAANSARVRQLASGFAFPVAMATSDRLPGYGRIWRLPMTFVIDRNGILRKDQWYSEAGLDVDELTRTLRPLLAHGGAETPP